MEVGWQCTACEPITMASRSSGIVAEFASHIDCLADAGQHQARSLQARLGSVKALAPLDPLRGLAALTESSVSPTWAAMCWPGKSFSKAMYLLLVETHDNFCH